jgi:hypothetical protein
MLESIQLDVRGLVEYIHGTSSTPGLKAEFMGVQKDVKALQSDVAELKDANKDRLKTWIGLGAIVATQILNIIFNGLQK